MPRKALIVDDEPDTGHLLSENSAPRRGFPRR